MRTSRRNFIETASSAAAGLCFPPSIALHPRGSGCEAAAGCFLIDLGPGCALPESLLGYQAVLADEASCISVAEMSLKRPRLVIVPGIGTLDSNTAPRLVQMLDTGANVLLESGAGFLGATEFAQHQAMLRDSFGVFVDSPADVWSGAESVPYITYKWPRETMVRDFSRVVPVAEDAAETIGRMGALVIGIKKSVRKGTLIFIGSPLGPALRVRDPEARAWLQALYSHLRIDMHWRNFINFCEAEKIRLTDF